MKTLFVARGRTLVVDDNRKVKQGELVTLSDEEADRLKALGAVQDTPPNIAPLQVAPRGQPGPVNTGMVQGPDYGMFPRS